MGSYHGIIYYRIWTPPETSIKSEPNDRQKG